MLGGGIVLAELPAFGSFTQKPPGPFPRAWLTVMVPSSERSGHLSAQASPRLMPVVSAISAARPSGWGSASMARRSMRVRSSREGALIGAFTRLGGLRKSQGFLDVGSCATAHLSACLRRRKAFERLLGA